MKTQIKSFKSEKFVRNMFIVCIVLLFLIMFVLNSIVPLTSDDYGDHKRTSLIGILKGVADHYINWNGRSIGMFNTALFLSLPKVVFNVVNSLVYTWIITLIYIYANSPKKYNLLLLTFIIASVGYFTVVYGEVFLWISGVVHYSWGMAIILTFLLPYYYCVIDKKIFSKVVPASILMLIAGIIAGWCNENTSGACIMLIVFATIYLYVKKRKIPLWMWSGLVGTITGLVILLLAPGNSVRLNKILDIDAPSIGMSPFAMGTRFFHLTNFLLQDLFPLVLTLIILFIMIFITNKDKQKIIFPSACILAGLAAIYVFVLTPINMEKRAGFGATILFIIAASYCFANINIRGISEKIVVYGVTAVIGLQFVSSFLYGSMDIVYSRVSENQRMSEIRKMVSMDVKNVVTYRIEYKSPLTKYNPLYAQPDITGNTSHWVNRGVSNMLGIDSIYSIAYDEWEKVYKNGAPELIGCFDFQEYTNLLDNDNYLILMSMKGMTSILDDDSINKLMQLGLYDPGLSDVKANYLTVLDSGKQIVQSSADEPIYYVNSLGDLQLAMACDYISNDLVLKIDNIDYSKQRDGVSFVVYDKVTRCIADSVVFLADDDLTGIR